MDRPAPPRQRSPGKPPDQSSAFFLRFFLISAPFRRDV
jgi:hypothetical protein